jgi:hypothetical protein
MEAKKIAFIKPSEVIIRSTGQFFCCDFASATHFLRSKTLAKKSSKIATF